MSQINEPDLNEDKDINDVFDDILLSENKIYDQGYQEGYKKGVSETNIEGYHLGYHRGAELGAELGYYLSIAENYLNRSDQAEYSEKIKHNLTTIVKLIKEFPIENVDNVDIFAETDKIRSAFKKACALLKIDAHYSEIDHLSF
ncbi:hypothetical protein MML48_7g00010045 [Holotrichia oblita]|uniref:Uncharacterized protein n=1 Tax=Holotrichia oblita TaxID=644536 RepID=A0ACB9SVY6_HOLOL|nr:hypothetical protein MML48_7g00010045 [Holotrichia oblita]